MSAIGRYVFEQQEKEDEEILASEMRARNNYQHEVRPLTCEERRQVEKMMDEYFTGNAPF